MSKLLLLLLSLLLSLLLPTHATPQPLPPILSLRQPVCRLPRVICPGNGCVSCPEVGNRLVNTLISLRSSLLRGNPSFPTLAARFAAFTAPNGRADLTARTFRRNCCVRLFRTQVAADVPRLIAFAYLGRAVYPGTFLGGYQGFLVANPDASIRDFVAALGRDFRGEFFNTCRFMGTFEIPCLRGPLASLRTTLQGFALQNSIENENALGIGFSLGTSLGAFTETSQLIARDMGRALRFFFVFELNRCCPAP